MHMTFQKQHQLSQRVVVEPKAGDTLRYTEQKEEKRREKQVPREID